jgi:hypothetical protein
MKRWLPLVVFALAGVTMLPAETVQEVYARGVRAYSGGNIEVAKASFEAVVAADPRNESARAFLRRIAATKPSGGGIRMQMQKLVVPKVDFHDASVSTILDYLPTLATQLSGGKASLNIVRMFPAEYGQEKKITLQLSSAPMASVLDYTAQLAGLKIDYQPHAVVFSRPESAAPTATPAQ